jgi:membrane-anchored mycosin MYCP
MAAVSAAVATAIVLAPAAALAAPLAASVDMTPAAGQCMAATHAVSAAVPWAQQQLQPATVWGLTEGRGQVVAVLDSGVSAAAPALSGAVMPGLNAVTGGRADTDCTGHGTFAAGIIAARPAPGSGFTGLAPQARILPVNVIGADGSVTAGAVAAGIRFAVGQGATIVDISPASTPPGSPALQAAVAYAAARNVVVIAPVAENENEANEVSYPAAYPGVVAVCAVDSTGTPVAAGAPGVRVDLAAPGWNVASIGPHGPGQITGGEGAAVATAFVAAAAALVRSYYPQLTAAQVVHRLEATADPPGTAPPSPEVGYGEIDPYTAVTTVLSEESGGLAPAAAPRAVRLPPLRPADTWPVTAGLIACGAVAVLLITVLAAADIARHGRRRGWRPTAGRGGWGNPEPRPPAGDRR